MSQIPQIRPETAKLLLAWLELEDLPCTPDAAVAIREELIPMLQASAAQPSEGK